MDYLFPQVFILLISILGNLFLSIPLINLLYKYHFYKDKKTLSENSDKRNPKYYNYLLSNMDTPSSFGVLLFFNLIVFYLFNNDPSINILLITFGLFLLLGLYDDITKYFLYEKSGRYGLRLFPKLLLQGFILIPLYMSDLNTIYPLFMVFIVLFLMNSVNITDGLDGLVGTILLYIIPILIFFEMFTYNNAQIINFLTIILGFLIVFLYFNIKPARVFLGDVGSLSLGFLVSFITIRYGLVPSLVLFSLIIIEGLSSLSQMISLRIFNRRLFKIAPFHLHLLNIGWTDTKIVQRAGILQIVFSLVSVFLFLFL